MGFIQRIATIIIFAISLCLIQSNSYAQNRPDDPAAEPAPTEPGEKKDRPRPKPPKCGNNKLEAGEMCESADNCNNPKTQTQKDLILAANPYLKAQELYTTLFDCQSCNCIPLKQVNIVTSPGSKSYSSKGIDIESGITTDQELLEYIMSQRSNHVNDQDFAVTTTGDCDELSVAPQLIPPEFKEISQLCAGYDPKLSAGAEYVYENLEMLREEAYKPRMTAYSPTGFAAICDWFSRTFTDRRTINTRVEDRLNGKLTDTPFEEFVGDITGATAVVSGVAEVRDNGVTTDSVATLAYVSAVNFGVGKVIGKTCSMTGEILAPYATRILPKLRDELAALKALAKQTESYARNASLGTCRTAALLNMYGIERRLQLETGAFFFWPNGNHRPGHVVAYAVDSLGRRHYLDTGSVFRGEMFDEFIDSGEGMFISGVSEYYRRIKTNSYFPNPFDNPIFSEMYREYAERMSPQMLRYAAGSNARLKGPVSCPITFDY